MRLRRLLALLVFLVAPAAWGATYHVTSNDKDGNGVSDQNGTCANHATVGTSWVSCADSVTAGCTEAKPCCTIQAALDKATGQGDIVEIHTGTYNPALDGGGGSKLIYTFNTGYWLVVKPCPTCSTSAHMRTIRGASNSDNPIITASSTSGFGWPILIGTGSGTTSWVTLQRLEVTGFDFDGAVASGKPVGMIQNDGYVTDIVLDNIYAHDLKQGNDSCAAGQGRYIGIIGFTNGGGGADRIEIKNSRLYSDTCGIIFALSGSDVGDKSCINSTPGGITGIDIHHNEIISYNTLADDNTHEIGFFKNLDEFANRNNVIKCLTDSVNCGMYYRQNAGSTYIFNNYFYNFAREYSQDPCGTMYLFNNTVIWNHASTSSLAQGFRYTEFSCGNLRFPKSPFTPIVYTDPEAPGSEPDNAADDDSDYSFKGVTVGAETQVWIFGTEAQGRLLPSPTRSGPLTVEHVVTGAATQVIEYSTDGGTVWNPVATSTTALTTTVVATGPVSQLRVRATANNASGESRVSQIYLKEADDCTYHARNNSFYRMYYATDGVAKTTFNGGYEHTGLSNPSRIYNVGSQGNSQDIEAGNYICTDADACGSNTRLSDCSGTGGCNALAAESTFYQVSGAKPYPWYKLGATSALIGKGTSNPIGQGANVCSITLWAGHVIDCTTDYEGDVRGSVWDIGADEFASAGPGPPAVKGSGTQGSGTVIH